MEFCFSSSFRHMTFCFPTKMNNPFIAFFKKINSCIFTRYLKAVTDKIESRLNRTKVIAISLDGMPFKRQTWGTRL